jgi:hypothetical protein
MSTEQKPEPPKPLHLKEQIDSNALGHTLLTTWEKFKAGQLIGYRWMGLILIAITAIIVTIYIVSEKSKAKSQLWVELDGANSLTALEKFAESHPNTQAGRAAEMDRARILLGPDGIEKLPNARDEGERKRAIDNVEKARQLMTRLIDEFQDDPILKLECLMGMAKSEAAFIGISKEGSVGEFRGSIPKLIEWLDKVSEAAEGTPWGEDAKKLSESLKNGSKRDEPEHVQRSLYALSPFSGLPGGGPLAPGGGPGLPPIGGCPGPGTSPLAPPIAPPIAPPAPSGTPLTPGPVAPPKTPSPPMAPLAPGPVAPPKSPPAAPIPTKKTPEPKIPEPKTPLPTKK